MANAIRQRSKGIRICLLYSDNMEQKGFTLVELLITLAVGAVLLGTAVPSLTSMIINNRLTAQANDFVGALQFARSEALRRARYITLCSSTDGAACATSTDWQTGYIVFVDNDGDATFDIGDEILRVIASLEGNSTFTGSVSSIRYMPTGYSLESQQASPSTYAFTLTADGCTGDQERVININPIGRPTVSKSSC